MEHRKTMLTAVLLALFAGAPLPSSGSALAADVPAVRVREGWYRNIVDTDFVGKYAGLPRSAGAMLIDSRPAARQYDVGHIPGAINIPDSKFESMTDQLPRDKATLLIFYCGGLECLLSHKSAFKAEQLGYTNIKVYAEGQPEWVKRGNPVAVPAPKARPPAIEQGKEAGIITVASFERIYKEAPDSILLVDVRDAAELSNGTFRGALNIPINALEKRLDALPTDKPVVFFCGTGGRSGEAYDMAKLLKPTLRAYFLDADLSFGKDGAYTLVEHK